MKHVFNALLSFLIAIGLTLVSPLSQAKSLPKAIPTELGNKIVQNYAAIVYQSYRDALNSAKDLKSKLEIFLANPTSETLEASKLAWKAARDTYSPTEVFRFYGAPIDDPENGPEGLINAWPMDESYLDYVKGQNQAGIINNPKEYPTINKELMLSLNEKNGEKNISTGLHAIEFLLWGQDFSLDGPGSRPLSDYTVSSPTTQRRKEVLKILADLLIDHLTLVMEKWTPNVAGNYADKFKKEPLDEGLRKIYTGVISLSIDEMAGERMTVPLEVNDQENEQDCFSDYTIQDLISNQVGIQRVYFGKYKGENGPGLHDLVKTLDSSLAKKTESQVQLALKNLQSINKSFDQIIASKSKSSERKKVLKAIGSLEEQARIIAKSGLSMGLVLNIQ